MRKPKKGMTEAELKKLEKERRKKEKKVDQRTGKSDFALLAEFIMFGKVK